MNRAFVMASINAVSFWAAAHKLTIIAIELDTGSHDNYWLVTPDEIARQSLS